MTYKEWLQSSYNYYYTDRDSLMPDAVWDQLSRKYAPIIANYFDVDYDGGSLFWIMPAQYPNFVNK